MILYIKKSYTLFKTEEYEDWVSDQPYKSQVQILSRLDLIEELGYFGEHKFLDGTVWELKWANGRRIYYSHIATLNVLIILGGNKNGQNKDIAKARSILRKYTAT